MSPQEKLDKIVNKGIARRLLIDYSNEFATLMNRYLDDEMSWEQVEPLSVELDEKYAQLIIERISNETQPLK